MGIRAKMDGKRIRKILAGGMAAACLFSCALGEDNKEFRLPAGLVTVEEDAFAGIPSLREITVPATLETEFGTAFPESDETIWVHCPPGDAALRLLNQGLDVDAGTVCRALLIGQTYPGYPDREENSNTNRLYGPANDIAAMRQMLAHLDRLDFQVTTKSNLTSTEILEAIPAAFAEAAEYDISLFFFSGHGGRGGNLVGCWNGLMGPYVSPAALRNALDQIPGRKVVIIDACYSGGILEEEFGGTGGSASLNAKSLLSKESYEAMNSARNGVNSPPGDAESCGQAEDGAPGTEAETEGQENPAEFNSSFLSAFGSVSSGRKMMGARGAGTGYSAYYIMTAAAASEESFEFQISEAGSQKYMGFFTYYLCRGIGWSGVAQSVVSPYADADEDGLVTFGEAFTYAAAQTAARVASLATAGETQNAQSNAGNLQSFSPFR